MSTSIIPYSMTGGYDRSQLSDVLFRSGMYYDLEGLRHSRTTFGRLEQTPRFTATSRTAKDYYDGSTTVTEASTTQIAASWQQVLFTTQTATTAAGVSIPVFYQSAVPTGTGLTKGCLLIINNVAGLAITLGNTVDIEIDGATTFRWRKNGGGWTATVPITTSGVSIDGGNATVYFLTATGFTVTDAWSFQRTDRMLDTSASVAVLTTQYSMQAYEGDLIFNNANYRIMLYDPTVGYIRSVGYRPIYGHQVRVYQEHLFVTNALKDSIVTGSGVTTSTFVYNSDKTDLDAFFPTDVNEADEFHFENNGVGPFSTSAAIPWRIGCAVVGDLLYLFTPWGVLYTNYLGLPTVFSFQPFATFRLSVYSCTGPAVIESDAGAYIIRDDGPWFFNGSTFEHVGKSLAIPVSSSPSKNAFVTFAGLYDYDNKEFILYYASSTTVRSLYTLQERYQRWHRRSVSFLRTPVSFFIYSSTTITNRLGLGGSHLTWYDEDPTFTQQPAQNASLGTVHLAPSVEFHVYDDRNFDVVKELRKARILATVSSSGVSTTYYSTSTDANISFLHARANTNDPTLSSYSVDATWSSSTLDGLLTFNGFAFRGMMLKLSLVGAVSGKPAANISIHGFEVEIHQTGSTTPTR